MLVFVCLLGAASTTLAQSNNNGTGQVQKITGKYVFIYAEPTQPYDVVFEVKSVMVPLMSCPSISDMAAAVVKKALKEDKEFDAVVIGAGKRDIAIKFK